MDIELKLDENGLQGTVFASTNDCMASAAGLDIGDWTHDPLNPVSHSPWQAFLRSV
ncbi:hypothetical protein [Cohnella rhizosphaerae]|uniref:Uncharacterized protein n=1 Tax=Cohnella rhizosphaerae TaxID=1457232 RepID=A0A9X4L4V9_9BACL|nr:hypothetical protein [Cohnella rhizosphaerae]MDG0813517.1 hypothetical protein [Cohnella rhizosphaerae]